MKTTAQRSSRPWVRSCTGFGDLGHGEHRAAVEGGADVVAVPFHLPGEGVERRRPASDVCRADDRRRRARRRGPRPRSRVRALPGHRCARSARRAAARGLSRAPAAASRSAPGSRGRRAARASVPSRVTCARFAGRVDRRPRSRDRGPARARRTPVRGWPTRRGS